MKFTLTAPARAGILTGVLIMSSVNCSAGSPEKKPSEAAQAGVQSEMKEPGRDMVLSDDQKQFLLKLARQSLEACVREQPPPSPTDAPAVARQKCGCFVTLTKRGDLRGCIGYLEGIKPLYEAVIDNAENAALRDHRFSPVRPEELAEIRVEISVLTPPVPLEHGGPDDLLKKLVPGQDGIILKRGFQQSTFLPQVWDQLPDKVQFLEHLSTKGGMPRDGWKSAEVLRYRAIHFEESAQR